MQGVRTWSPGSRPRQWFPPPPPPDWSLNPMEETLLQPLLKSFALDFIQNNNNLEQFLLFLANFLATSRSRAHVKHNKVNDIQTKSIHAIN